MNVWVMMDECIFVRQACWIRLEMGESLDVYPNMEVFYQEWGRLIYVRGFQLISGIQHAILQICVCVRKGYANECRCEGWVKLGECVRGVEIGIHYRTDLFYVVDVYVCVEGISPRFYVGLIDKPLWMDITYHHHWGSTRSTFTDL